MLAAVLAVLGYSVNESVVIFDRIREPSALPQDDTREVIDHAITSTTSRTIITHGCTQMMVLSMLLFGGSDAALLRGGADHRHPVRHLLVGVRGRRHRDVAGVKRRDLVKARRPQGRDPNDPNAGAVV